LADLLLRTFADPDIVLGLDRLQAFLLPDSLQPARQFHVLAAELGRRVVGGCIFSYVPATGCGFSEYILTAPDVRRTGLGRQLFQARRDTLHADARAAGRADGCRGLFLEVEDPDRAPTEVVQAERETAMDAWERRAYFRHLGFRKIAVPYVQLPLGEGKSSVPYLDLLFLPWDPDIASADALPADWLLPTVQAIWQRWAPDVCPVELARLRAALPGPSVPLLPL
jgi:GNAT superfamily N-acetyltransferase